MYVTTSYHTKCAKKFLQEFFCIRTNERTNLQRFFWTESLMGRRVQRMTMNLNMITFECTLWKLPLIACSHFSLFRTPVHRNFQLMNIYSITHFLSIYQTSKVHFGESRCLGNFKLFIWCNLMGRASMHKYQLDGD